MFTLTLIERETCTNECEHYYDCFGNNMPFAHRFEVNRAFMLKTGKRCTPHRAR